MAVSVMLYGVFSVMNRPRHRGLLTVHNIGGFVVATLLYAATSLGYCYLALAWRPRSSTAGHIVYVFAVVGLCLVGYGPMVLLAGRKIERDRIVNDSDSDLGTNTVLAVAAKYATHVSATLLPAAAAMLDGATVIAILLVPYLAYVIRIGP